MASQSRDKKPSGRRTDCITCDGSYFNYLPPPIDPRLLRARFRRRPFGAPKPAPLHIIDCLNHADIAPLPPAVVPGQECHAYLTDWQQKELQRSRRGKRGGYGVPDDDEDGLLAVPMQWLCGFVGSGPFLAVLMVCSIYLWVTSSGSQSLWAARAVGCILLTAISMTVTKFFLGR